MTILNRWDIKITVDDVLWALGGNPTVIRARRPQLVQLAGRALEEGSDYLHPIVHYRMFEVEKFRHKKLIFSNRGHLSGTLIGEHLAAAQQVVLIGCTIGDQLESYAKQVMASDLLFGVALDSLGSAAVEMLGNAVCTHFEQIAQQSDLQAATPIAPGMNGWPVDEGQKQIFELLDLSQIGLQMTPSGMMQPMKSLTMVVGIGVEVMKAGTPCDFCQVRERCQYRSI